MELNGALVTFSQSVGALNSAGSLGWHKGKYAVGDLVTETVYFCLAHRYDFHVGCCCCRRCCSRINSHSQVRSHGTGSSHSGMAIIRIQRQLALPGL